MTDYTPKDILDKYATTIIRKNAIWTNDKGEPQVDQNKAERYNPATYRDDIVLWIPPLNWLRLEFDVPDSRKIIEKIESNLKVLETDYCITDHGGQSPYLNIIFKDIPLNEDNKIAKELYCHTIMDTYSYSKLDRTNLGSTLSPTIGHPHWKPKYHDAIHDMICGKSPLDHNNTYPKDLLKQIAKSKKTYKKNYLKTIQENNWASDFLINYCTTADMSKWKNRHKIIEKNLAILIIYHNERDDIIKKYKENKKDPAHIETWFPDIINGKYTEVNPGELWKYIQENNIDYIPPENITKKPAIEIQPDDDDIDILKDPRLLLKTVLEVQKQGVVGEETSILVLINKNTLRLVKNHNPTSSNILISDKSGAGKDIIVKTTLRIVVPENDIIHRTRFSDKALEYMCMGKDDFTFDGKVIYLEDPDDELIKSQAFRVLSSGQNKVTVVKDQELLELEVKGKPVIDVTSMNATIDEEGGRRWDGISIDTSEQQTINIIAKKLQLAKGYEKKTIPPIAKALHKLQRVEVIIPYTDDLVQYFKNNPSLIMRTQIDKLLDYIRASAALHQHQRQRNDNGQVIADYFDYTYGKFMFMALGDAEGGVLNVTEKKLVEILKEASGDSLSYKAIVNKGLGKSRKWLYDHENELVSKGVISLCEIWDDKANKNITHARCTFGYSSVPLPGGLVLTGFNPQSENQQQEGCHGFVGFINILRELNKKRDEHGLSKIDFEDIAEYEKFLKTLNSGENRDNRDNLSVEPMLKPSEDRLKPDSSSMNIDVNDHSTLKHIDAYRDGRLVIKPKKKETKKR